MRLDDAVAKCGYDFRRFPEAGTERKNAAAYLELHIEQGPVLEKMDLPLAAVLGTRGVERHAISFHEQEAHAGSTPMNQRRGALAAAAKLRSVRSPENMPIRSARWAASRRCLVLSPRLSGRCEATLDQRDLDATILAAMYAEAQNASRRFAEEQHCTVQWSKIWNIEPVQFHSKLLDSREEASHLMPSGPLHDAAEVARAGIPAIMIFVLSSKGISHNKIEDTKEEHLEMAVAALDRLASKAGSMDLAAS